MTLMEIQNILMENTPNFGNDSDLQIVHDGTNAVIQNATGQFFIDNNSSGGDIFLRLMIMSLSESMVTILYLLLKLVVLM